MQIHIKIQQNCLVSFFFGNQAISPHVARQKKEQETRKCFLQLWFFMLSDTKFGFICPDNYIFFFCWYFMLTVKPNCKRNWHLPLNKRVKNNQQHGGCCTLSWQKPEKSHSFLTFLNQYKRNSLSSTVVDDFV